MLISEAITEPKASTTIGAKYCGIQVNCLPKWEHFTFLFQLFSYFFLLSSTNIMWNRIAKQTVYG